MAREKSEIRCPWCGQTIPVSEVKIRHYQNDYGSVVERRCARCHKVLAAYLESAGDFLPRIRKF